MHASSPPLHILAVQDIHNLLSQHVDHIARKHEPGTIRNDPVYHQRHNVVVPYVGKAGVVLVQPCISESAKLGGLPSLSPDFHASG
jgi:hypothetical protein